jgi:hypothetical protein
LAVIEEDLRRDGAVVRRGGDFDRWDLEVRGGLLGCARLLMVVEEHGSGKQMFRLRTWPKFWGMALMLDLMFAGLAAMSVVQQAWFSAISLSLIVMVITFRLIQESAVAQAAIVCTLEEKTKERSYGLRRLRPSDVTEG